MHEICFAKTLIHTKLKALGGHYKHIMEMYICWTHSGQINTLLKGLLDCVRTCNGQDSTKIPQPMSDLFEMSNTQYRS